MNESKIFTSLEDCIKYFKSLNISVEINKNIKQLTINKFSNDYNNVLLYNKDDYYKLYTTAMENEDYDFHITKDNSFFQFYSEKVKNKVVSIHYVFYSCPKDVSLLDDIMSEEDNDAGNKGMYYNLIDSVDFKKNVLYFRFDYEKDLYKKIIHPIAHLHIGFDNEIRIPLDKILTPEAFVDFVMKYAYKELWQEAVKKNTDFAERIKILSSQCEELAKQFFTVEEREILHIT